MSDKCKIESDGEIREWPVLLFIPESAKTENPFTTRNLKNGIPYPGRNITFEEFSKDFFSWNGHRSTDKKAEGRRIGESHCKDRADIMKKVQL
jgi:hypothetical protein